MHLSVHSAPEPDTAAQRTARGRLKMLLILLVCAAPVVASYLSYYVIRPQGRSNYATLIDPQRPLPSPEALRLTDLQGRVVPPGSLRGQWLLIAVAGGGCDAACERQLYTQRQLREMLGKDRLRMDRVWLITDDAVPPPALQAGLEGATVLRADPRQLADWLVPESGQVLAAHLYLVDPLGNWMMRFPARLDPARARRDLDRLMRASASWDTEGREGVAAPRPASGGSHD